MAPNTTEPPVAKLLDLAMELKSRKAREELQMLADLGRTTHELTRSVRQAEADLRKKKRELEAHVLSAIEAPNALTGRRMLSPTEIIKAAVSPYAFPGVYFLIRAGAISYVGQSKNVFYRVAQHRRVEAWSYIACDPSRLDVLESLYIHWLQPPGNASEPGGPMNAPLTMEALMGFMEAGLDRALMGKEGVGSDETSEAEVNG